MLYNLTSSLPSSRSESSKGKHKFTFARDRGSSQRQGAGRKLSSYQWRGGRLCGAARAWPRSSIVVVRSIFLRRRPTAAYDGCGPHFFSLFFRLPPHSFLVVSSAHRWRVASGYRGGLPAALGQRCGVRCPLFVMSLDGGRARGAADFSAVLRSSTRRVLRRFALGSACLELRAKIVRVARASKLLVFRMRWAITRSTGRLDTS